ncbi:Protein of unknown function [Ferrimonas sediminum]|uniref:DUF2947 domain-containing protein n=1 Tax=Ferrimonas sediminum TaxID=718193 RepID=A0A1G8T6L8_9GAMM|nr:DUF2947 family protein [Ferrimonas sediminum]SDJ36635.1 Protein of unknown function [Ferrimonas sediminum]
MKYSDFSLYPYLWVFKRDDMGVDPVDMDQIKPLTPRAADELWQAQISKNGNHCTDLRKGDWAKNQNTWTTETRWDHAFEADDSALPEAVGEQLEWDPNTVVWICYGSDHVVETNWRVFRRNWKCFLFADEAALVIGKRRQQALFFVDDTTLRIGNRPG